MAWTYDPSKRVYRDDDGQELAEPQLRPLLQRLLDSTVERTRSQHVERTPWLLLGGLEHQAHPAWQLRRGGHRESCAQECRGVRVVPARVTHARHRGREGKAGGLGQP